MEINTPSCDNYLKMIATPKEHTSAIQNEVFGVWWEGKSIFTLVTGDGGSSTAQGSSFWLQSEDQVLCVNVRNAYSLSDINGAKYKMSKVIDPLDNV